MSRLLHPSNRENREVSVNIDENVYKRSKELGVNVSRACTNYLKFLNSQIEQTLSENNGFLDKPSFTKEGLVRSPRFEPGSSAWQGPTNVDWQAFERFLQDKNYRGSGYRTKLSYATRYHGFLFRGELGKLVSLSPDQRSNALKALSVLCQFLGCHDLFKKEMKRFNLKWVGKSADQLFIERLSNSANKEDVWLWVREVKRRRVDLAPLLDLMAVSGLRFVEAVNCVNLAVELQRKGELDKYYNVEKGSFEHFRFEDLFLRRSKKAFVSFVPQEVVESICASKPLSSVVAVSKQLRKQRIKPRFADIREAHGTFMVKFLRAPEIDFIHGRVTGSVFMAHYFNPASVADLRERVLKGVGEILEKVKV